MLVALMLGALAVAAQESAPDPTTVQLEEVVTGLTRPLLVTHAGDGSGRLFVVEQGGLIKVVADGEVLDTPFLDVAALLHRDVFGGGFTERGLLGLAFDPDYTDNGLFYIDYTDVNGNTVVAQYHVSADDPNVADPDSAITVLTQAQPYANHNGGHLAFGPDGYLYIAFGDGGSAGDPQANGQNPATLLGTIARIDVQEDGSYTIPDDNPAQRDERFAPEVWAYGLRNPWRFSFDTETGDLYIGDVGQNQWEEIDFEPADSPGGVNYGWSVFEASQPYSGGEATEDMVFPVAEYNHGQGISITAGHVYRGSALPELAGVFFYGDFGFGTIWALWQDEAGTWQSQPFMEGTGRTISSFGVDEANELYVVDYNGVILRFAPAR
jgi:glucose/arabinose dehydrogenase